MASSISTLFISLLPSLPLSEGEQCVRVYLCMYLLLDIFTLINLLLELSAHGTDISLDAVGSKSKLLNDFSPAGSWTVPDGKKVIFPPPSKK